VSPCVYERASGFVNERTCIYEWPKFTNPPGHGRGGLIRYRVVSALFEEVSLSKLACPF